MNRTEINQNKAIESLLSLSGTLASLLGVVIAFRISAGIFVFSRNGSTSSVHTRIPITIETCITTGMTSKR